MIDVDESGDLEKEEIVIAVKSNQKVIKFLVNCGEPNLQNLLVPSRLEATLAVLDTDRDGHIDAMEWEACIESALANKLAERAARRELQAKAAQKEIEEFTAEFKSAARRCFQLIDKDGGGTLSHDEIVEAVKTDQEVISFLKTCGEENLMFLLHPPRLKKALEALDAGAKDACLLASAAKAKMSETLHGVSNEMVQMHGGIGMTDAHDAGLYMKRARVLEALYGGASYHRDRFATLSGF